MSSLTLKSLMGYLSNLLQELCHFPPSRSTPPTPLSALTLPALLFGSSQEICTLPLEET